MRFCFVLWFFIITASSMAGQLLTDLEIIKIAIELNRVKSSSVAQRLHLFPFMAALGIKQYGDISETVLRQKLLAFRHEHKSQAKEKCIEFFEKSDMYDLKDAVTMCKPTCKKIKFQQWFLNTEHQQSLTTDVISHISPRLADTVGLSGSVVELVLKLGSSIKQIDEAGGWQLQECKKVEDLLNLWMKNVPFNATKERLKAGLEDIGRGDVIGKLEELPRKGMTRIGKETSV